MSSQTSILIYGRDRQLLETRQWVLEGAGYRVSKATELAGLAQLVPVEQIDLLILCHTLSQEECGRALAVVSTRWPQVHTLLLHAGRRGSDIGSSGDVVDMREGPAKFLKTVSRLVHQGSGLQLTQ